MKNNNKNNNSEKELVNGKYYTPNTKGCYFPSKEYIEHFNYHREAPQRIKQKKQYAQIVETQVFKNYTLTINNFRRKTAELYGKIYYLADNEIGNIFQQIKKIMQETNEKVSTMIQDLRSFLGYNFIPSRYEGNKIVPIEPNRIRQAWDMLKNKTNNFIAIENVLMFN